MLKIVHSSDMPVPTSDRPWAQVEWLFEQREKQAKSGFTKANYRNARSHYISFLKETILNFKEFSGYWVDKEFDEYSLLRFKQFIDDKNFSSSHTASILSATRQTFEVAITNRWVAIEKFIDFSLPIASRETDIRFPYAEKEMSDIMKALNEDVQFARRLLKPYVKTGLGREPVITRIGNMERVESGWWYEENNLRWYFENRLDCIPITGSDPVARKKHGRFLTHATLTHGGLHKLYRRWGVSAWIGPEIVLPYLCKLVAETGLNPSVASALRINDYQESHPLTGQPYIRYWKERGSGEGELHVGMIGGGFLALDERQNREVGRIWAEVIKLTASFRQELPPENQDFLFIYQTRSVKYPGKARDFMLDITSIYLWTKEFVERHQLRDKKDQALILTLVRFRPSLVSRLLKRDVDIYIIKSILGHSSILTTLRYIDSYDLAPKSRQEVRKAIEYIRENRREQETSPKPVAGEKFEENKVVFTTGIALCKNVFNPPENIRKAAGMEVGSPCSLFNICLRCPNVLVMQEHLPKLFALRRQYLAALDQGISAIPNHAAIQQNLHILNNLLDPGSSDWPEEILNMADKLSEFEETIADPIAIRGVGI